MRPLFPWTGNKRRLVRTIVGDTKPSRIIEPFAGSAALFFDKELPGVLIDTNRHLMSIYEDLRNEPDDLHKRLLQHVRTDSATHYYETRYLLNRGQIRIGVGAAALYLIKAGRNGLWRVDQSGHLNTPYGHRPHLPINVHQLRRAGELLSKATLLHGDWSNVVDFAVPGDLVYFDPPYGLGFNGYTPLPFREWDLLAHCADILVSNSVAVAVSDYNRHESKTLFAGKHPFGQWRRIELNIVRRHNPKQPVNTVESLFLSY